MHCLKTFVILLLPLLALGGLSGDKDEPSWESKDDYTLNPKASGKDDLPVSQQPLRTDPVEDKEDTGDVEAKDQDDKETLPFLLKRLIEEEMLKRSEEDKLPKENKSDEVIPDDTVNTPLTYMTPPPPPKEEDVSTTPFDYSGESDEESSTAESVPNTEVQQPQPFMSPPEDKTPIEEDPRMSPKDKKTSSSPSEDSPVDESTNSQENEVQQYAERFNNYEQQHPMRQSEDQEDQRIEGKSSGDEESDGNSEFEIITTELPPIEDISSSESEPAKHEIPSPPAPAAQSPEHEESPPLPTNNGMDKVIFDKEQPDDETSTTSGPTEPPKEKYYFFLQPRPSVPTYPPRYTSGSESQNQLYYNPYILRPNSWNQMQPSPFMMNYYPSISSDNAVSPQSQYSQYQPPVPLPLFQNQPMIRTPDDLTNMPSGVRPTYTFPPYYSQRSAPMMYPTASSGLGFSGDYLRNPYFWSNPYYSSQVPVPYQRISTSPFYYAF